MSKEVQDVSPVARRRFKLTEKQSKFVREVGSVVLGVLIALGIGEVADAARWQWRVSVSEAAMRAELAGNRFNVAERRSFQACATQRLGDIGAILAEARRTHRLPDIARIGGPGRRPTHFNALDSATSEGVLLHMRRETARDYSGAYVMARYYDDEVEQESPLWARLRLLEHAPGTIDGDLLTTLLDAWAQLKSHTHWIGMIAEQTDDELDRLGVAIESMPAGATYQSFKRDGPGMSPLCKPLIVDGKPYIPKIAS
ncbi:MAG: hypothetical protein EOP58_09530 [Sphingomonadales bacterium]|nr:MAG: hypothetical protein EOP58_09530 [Sphingomonadales bacterium]